MPPERPTVGRGFGGGELPPSHTSGEPGAKPPIPARYRGRGRRRRAGGPTRLRPLSCGRGAAGWKGRNLRPLSRACGPNSRAGWGGDGREGAITCVSM